MLPLRESAVLTGQIRLQSENYFNKSKLNTLLSIFSLRLILTLAWGFVEQM